MTLLKTHSQELFFKELNPGLTRQIRFDEKGMHLNGYFSLDELLKIAKAHRSFIDPAQMGIPSPQLRIESV